MTIDKNTGLLVIGGQNSGGGGGGSSSSGGSFYRCTAVDTAAGTWSGNKATIADGVYVYEEAVTTGLTFTAITPKVGKTYSADALVEAKLWVGAGTMPVGVPTDQLLAWFPLTVNAADAYGGHNDAIVKGNVDFSEGYATNWSTSNYIQLPGGIMADSQKNWTFGLLIKKPERGWHHDFAEVEGSNAGVALYDQGGWYHIQEHDYEWTAVNDQPFQDWLLFIVANSPSIDGSMKVYTNGNMTRSADGREVSINSPITLGVLNRNGSIENPTAAVTQMKHVFFYGKALSADEVRTMYQAMQSAGELD